MAGYMFTFTCDSLSLHALYSGIILDIRMQIGIEGEDWSAVLDLFT